MADVIENFSDADDVSYDWYMLAEAPSLGRTQKYADMCEASFFDRSLFLPCRSKQRKT